jgi:hypothetical protein
MIRGLFRNVSFVGLVVVVVALAFLVSLGVAAEAGIETVRPVAEPTTAERHAATYALVALAALVARAGGRARGASATATDQDAA